MRVRPTLPAPVPDRIAAEQISQARLRIDLTLAAVQGLCAAAGDRWADASAERIAARAVRIADATAIELSRGEGATHARGR
jgi:hypothetical protein